MFFTNEITPTPAHIPFNWAVDYNDGTHVTEYNLNNNKPNSFYDIKQENATRFGLFGQGMKFYFNTSDGSFYLNGRRAEVFYEVKGEKILLTNSSEKKDFITYKQAYTEYNKKQGAQRSNIESINFGYKTNILNDDIEIYFQIIVSLPFDDKAYMQIKMTSNKDIDGDLVFVTRRKETDRYNAPLKKGASGNINWTIK